MKIKKVDDGYFVVLGRGEKIIENLLKLARDFAIPSGVISGVGAVMNAKLGFYHLSKKTYDERFFADEHELIGLSGNVSWLKDNPVIHCHIVMGNTQFAAIAGHLFEAEIAVTGEIFVFTKTVKVARCFDSKIGLNLMEP